MGRFVIMSSSYHHKSGSRKRKERKDREEQMLNAQKGQKSITTFFPGASEPEPPKGQLQAETVSVSDVLPENQVNSSESTSASAWVSNN